MKAKLRPTTLSSSTPGDPNACGDWMKATAGSERRRQRQAAPQVINILSRENHMPWISAGCLRYLGGLVDLQSVSGASISMVKLVCGGGGGGGGGAVKVGNITQKGQHRPTRKLQTSANFFGGGMSRAARRGLQWTQPT